MLQSVWLSIFRAIPLNTCILTQAQQSYATAILNPQVQEQPHLQLLRREFPKKSKVTEVQWDEFSELLSQISFYTNEETEVQTQPRVTPKVRTQLQLKLILNHSLLV